MEVGLFMENKIGGLEVNEKADTAGWDRDLYAISAEQIKELKCLMTLVDSEMVYSSPDSPVTTSVR
jgi:predicted amidohydrolase YtcJ